MYKFKAELINKATNIQRIEKSNNMATLLRLVKDSKNTSFKIFSTANNKLMIVGGK